METRPRKLIDDFRNKKLTLKQLTQLRYERNLEPVETQPSSSKQPIDKKQTGLTTLLTVAQKDYVDAKARLNAAQASDNAIAVTEATIDAANAMALLNGFYQLASENLDNVYGAVENCPFANKLDDVSGYTQFWFAVQCFQTEETYLLLLHRYLLHKRVSTDTLSKDNLDPVTVELLSQTFCHPFEDKDESTFFSALRIQNTVAMKVMLDLCPDLAFRANVNFFPPAHYAAMLGNLEALKLLRSSNAETLTQTLHGSKITTLMIANTFARFEAMAWILANAPTLRDSTNQYGETALHQAVVAGSPRHVAFLLRNEADFTVKTLGTSKHPNVTALDVAVTLKDRSAGHNEVHQILMNPLEDGYTLFHRAIIADQTYVTKLFCKCGVDFTVKTGAHSKHPNMTAMQLAYGLRKNEELYAILDHCFEAAEKAATDAEQERRNTPDWQEKKPEEQELILLKIKFKKLEALLALETCPVVSVAPSVNYNAPDQDNSGQLAEQLQWLFDILAYTRIRNNGRKHTNKPAEPGMKKTLADGLKFVDRQAGSILGVKVSELSIVSNLRDIASYSELEKLRACWQVFHNILQKLSDPLSTFTEGEIQIFCNERLGKAAKPMVDHHKAIKERTEAERLREDDSTSSQRRAFQ